MQRKYIYVHVLCLYISTACDRDGLFYDVGCMSCYLEHFIETNERVVGKWTPRKSGLVAMEGNAFLRN